MDERVTIGLLKKRVCEFRDARGWLGSDTPRSLAISISIEAAELLEHFQWRNDDQMREAMRDDKVREGISDELADVICYCLGFSDVMNIDISDAVERKLRKSEDKYPVVRPKASA